MIINVDNVDIVSDKMLSEQKVVVEKIMPEKEKVNVKLPEETKIEVVQAERPAVTLESPRSSPSKAAGLAQDPPVNIKGLSQDPPMAINKK